MAPDPSGAAVACQHVARRTLRRPRGALAAVCPYAGHTIKQLDHEFGRWLFGGVVWRTAIARLGAQGQGPGPSIETSPSSTELHLAGHGCCTRSGGDRKSTRLNSSH